MKYYVTYEVKNNNWQISESNSQRYEESIVNCDWKHDVSNRTYNVYIYGNSLGEALDSGTIKILDYIEKSKDPFFLINKVIGPKTNEVISYDRIFNDICLALLQIKERLDSQE